MKGLVAQSSLLGGQGMRLLGHPDMCCIARDTPLVAVFVSVVLRLTEGGCGASCGGGQRFRTREAKAKVRQVASLTHGACQIQHAAKPGGEPCTGSTHETEVCNEEAQRVCGIYLHALEAQLVCWPEFFCEHGLTNENTMASDCLQRPPGLRCLTLESVAVSLKTPEQRAKTSACVVSMPKMCRLWFVRG